MRRLEKRGTGKRLAGIALAVATLAMFQPGACGAGEKKAPLPIIPGAGGFGMETVAGSGRNHNPPRTTVIKVTNLNDSGPGSLRAACQTKGSRVIVFEVSGYINLKSEIFIHERSYLTIAGQTAPWPGIVVRGGFGIVINSNDVLIQHLGIRMGGQIKGIPYPFRGAMSPYGTRIIVDHCSFGWGTQAVNVNSSFCTLRLNIASEGLYNGGHNESNHAKGIGVRMGHSHHVGDDIAGITLIGNLMAHNEDRNPQATPYSSVATLNNVIYNYSGCGVKMLTDPLTASIEGNVFIPGPDTKFIPQRPWRGKAAWIHLTHKESRVFFSPDNLMAGKTYTNPWEHIDVPGGKSRNKSVPEAIVWKSPIAYPNYTVLPARKTEAWVCANVGSFPAHRNPIDARLMYEVQHRIGRSREDIDDLGGWPKLEENHRKLILPKHPNADDDNDGYTNLEEWLHAFADKVEGKKGPIPGVDPDLGKREAERCNLSQEEKLKEAKALYEKVKKQPKADWTFDAAEAKRRQKEAAKKVGLPVERKIDLGGGVAIDLVLIPPGEFEIGSKLPPKVIKWLRGPASAPRGQGGAGIGAVHLYKREHPRARLRVPQPFYMSKYEITRAVFDHISGTQSPGDPRLPVLALTSLGGPATGPRRAPTYKLGGFGFFIQKLNAAVGDREGLRFRVPLEAEWEYACRAGTDTPFWFGESISSKRANYDARYPWDGQHDWPLPEIFEKRGFHTSLMKVGSFPPNLWGLYDTVGNAAELVNPFYGPYPTPLGKTENAKSWSARQMKVAWSKVIRTVRGGSWRSPPSDCRSAYGMYLAVYNRRERCGLRLVAEISTAREARRENRRRK